MEAFDCGHPKFSWNTLFKRTNQGGVLGIRCKFCHYVSMIKNKGKVPVLSFERFIVAHYSGIDPRTLRHPK